MHRIASYLRISVKKSEEDESNSISGQRKLIDNYIKKDTELKSALKVEYIDDGYSGKNLNRPAFNKLYRAIEQGEISVLIVKDRSRIGRDLLEVGEFTENFLAEHNVRLICILDNIDTKTDNEDILSKATRDLMNQLYREDISQKVKKGLNAKMNNGTLICGQLPLGYKRVKDRIFVVPEDVEIIKRIYDLYIECQNLKEICRILNKEKVMTKKRLLNGEETHVWYPSEISGILKDTSYFGLFIYNKRKSEDKHIYNYNLFPPIISEDLFREVEDLRLSKSPKRVPKKDIRERLEYVLYCECGAAIIYKINTNSEITCTCSNVSLGGGTDKCVTKLKYEKNKLDKVVLNSLESELNKEKAVINSYKKQAEILIKEAEDIRKNIIKNDDDLKSIYLDFSNKRINLELFKQKQENLRTENESLKEKLEGINRKVNFYLSIDNKILNESIELKKEFISKYINRVIITNDNQVKFEYI